MEALQSPVAPSPNAKKGAMLASMSVSHLPTHLARGSLIADSTENYARGAAPPALMCSEFLHLCGACSGMARSLVQSLPAQGCVHIVPGIC